MSSISIKSNLVLAHIESLPEGSKVSVRELSSLLGVSEGTAYKGVKEAELQGLVLVKPKAGTVRVNPMAVPPEKTVSMGELIRHLNLGILAGRESAGKMVRRILVCDGSKETLVRQMEGTLPSECLCLCGDREEMQDSVLSRGANLLLTGGRKASWARMDNAEKKGLIILSSPLDTFSLLQLFHEAFPHREVAGDGEQIGNWMQTPDYLYYNDIVADWQQLYVESGLVKQYPIVDDNLEIYGGLDLWRAASGIPSQKLRSLLGDQPHFPVLDYRESPEKAARTLVTNREALAAVTDGKKMLGILTARDLLRYYMYSGQPAREGNPTYLLERDNAISDEERTVFHLRIPEAEIGRNRHLEADLMLSAIDCHLQNLGFPSYQLISSSIICSAPVPISESLMISSIMKRRDENILTFEVELNDDIRSCLRAFFVVTTQNREMED